MKMRRSRTIPDRILEVISLLVMIGTTFYLIVGWNSFPDRIPAHYNAAGEIDRWGGKGELIFLLVMMWILYIGITLIQRFPQIWNTGVQVTQENRERVYRILMYMLETLKLLMVAGLSFLTVYGMTGKNLPVWFLFVFMGALFADLIFWMVRLVRFCS
ncbi:MAG TPA: DUF1648 domain-containing protein [Candidatus Mediterraneibacter intestinipullorum]|nr:DUF1648 domain-containing protein [Candidatus Mediterraneibacter intestinipullorum]